MCLSEFRDVAKELFFRWRKMQLMASGEKRKEEKKKESGEAQPSVVLP